MSGAAAWQGHRAGPQKEPQAQVLCLKCHMGDGFREDPSQRNGVQGRWKGAGQGGMAREDPASAESWGLCNLRRRKRASETPCGKAMSTSPLQIIGNLSAAFCDKNRLLPFSL